MASEAESGTSEREYEDPEDAVFYAIHNAETPLTFDMIAERPETAGHDEEAIREGIEDWDFATIEYGDHTAYYLGSRESTLQVWIDREMYEGLRSKGHYIGEDSRGASVHLSGDFRYVGPDDWDDSASPDTWSPVFPTEDPTAPAETEPVADHASKTVLLEGTTGDEIEVTEVHTGCRRIPERMEVVRRTNTYYGPKLDLRAAEGYGGQTRGWRLTCPDADSHPILWRAIKDPDGFVHTRVRYSSVSVEVQNVAGYDICACCEEPIKDPFHRSLAMIGMCDGGHNDDGGEDGGD